MNVAARIEQSCRHVEYDIVVSSSVYEKTKHDMAMLEAGFVDLKGRTELEAVYVLVGNRDLLTTPEFQKLEATHRDLVAAIRDRLPQDNIEEICEDCVAMAEHIEPGLRQFYFSLSSRAADFRSDFQSNQLIFSHHSRESKKTA